MRSWWCPDTTQDSTSSAWRAARVERGDRALADVVPDARNRAELGDQLRRGREVVRDLPDGDIAARFEQRREVCVAPGPLGLGERAVGDLTDQLGLEVEFVAVDDDEIPFREPLEQPGRILPARERERGADRAAAADDRAVLEQRAFGRLECVEPGRDQAVQRGRQVPEAFGGCRARALRVLDVRDQLLDEERVAAAAFQQRVDHLVVGAALEQRVHELRGGRPVERIEMEHERVVARRLR